MKEECISRQDSFGLHALKSRAPWVEPMSTSTQPNNVGWWFSIPLLIVNSGMKVVPTCIRTKRPIAWLNRLLSFASHLQPTSAGDMMLSQGSCSCILIGSTLIECSGYRIRKDDSKALGILSINIQHLCDAVCGQVA